MKADLAQRFRPRLGLALTALVLTAVLVTALVVHVSWMWTASRNIETVVGSLNAQTANAVRQELETTFRAAEGATEIVRSILFQGAVDAADEVKREFVFLSVLRSLPSVSWIGFGFPDGRFFGSHALDDGKIEMVEIGEPLASGARYLRRDRYRPIPGDIFFEERTKGETAYVSLGSKWYRAAMTGKGQVWTMVDILPSGFEPAAVISTRLEQHGRLQGVLMVTLNLRRLASFLATLDVAKTGAAVIIGDTGNVIASSLPGMKSASLAENGGGSLIAALKNASQGQISADGTSPRRTGRSMQPTTSLDFNGWRLLTAIPRSAFTAEIDRNTRRLLIVVAMLALLAAIMAAVFAHLAFARPIQRIAGELRHIENLSHWAKSGTSRPGCANWMTFPPRSSAWRAASRHSGSMSRPTSSAASSRAASSPKPGGEAREITVMFADLPGFTKLTERLRRRCRALSHRVPDACHRSRSSRGRHRRQVHRRLHHGVLECTAARARACLSRLPCRQCDPRGHARAARGPTAACRRRSVRIGINTGMALVGHVGSAER